MVLALKAALSFAASYGASKSFWFLASGVWNLNGSWEDSRDW